MPTMPERVFISCGQKHDAEKSLGLEIVRLVKELTPFEPYFAETQRSLEGLTQNIFNNLNQAAGFIAVLHKRESLGGQDSHHRASLFVEQEIAVAAFVVHLLKRPLHVASFVSPEVPLEGVRAYLPFNARPFRSDDDVLDDLRNTLPAWRPGVATPPLVLLPRITRITTEAGGRVVHENQLTLSLRNVGPRRVDAFSVELEMPKGLLDNPARNMRTFFVPNRSQENKDFLRFTEANASFKSVPPGDELPLFNTRFVERTPDAGTATVTLRLDGFEPHRRELPLRLPQDR